ncbi:MAG: hypothetical protein HGA38_03540 [Candidatus Moranbacteria bacterium]|nr:hypothetical protein [Candidatus Moranbacteria bacterium]
MEQKFRYPSGDPNPDSSDAELTDAEIAFKNANRVPLSDEERLQALAPVLEEWAYDRHREIEREEDNRDTALIHEAEMFQGSPEEKKLMEPRLRRWESERRNVEEWKKKDPLKDTGKREE